MFHRSLSKLISFKNLPIYEIKARGLLSYSTLQSIQNTNKISIAKNNKTPCFILNGKKFTDITIGIPIESKPGENLVSLTPEHVKKLTTKGFKVKITKGAGYQSFFSDFKYKSAGGVIVNQKEALSSDVVFKVNSPNKEEVDLLSNKSTLYTKISFNENDSIIQNLSKKGITVFNMENVPRKNIMETLNLYPELVITEGYGAVRETYRYLNRFICEQKSSKGIVSPIKALIIGSNYNGMKALFTLRALGAKVSVYDKFDTEKEEEIEKLKAKFYSFDKDNLDKEKERDLLKREIHNSNIIISTSDTENMITKKMLDEIEASNKIIVDLTYSGKKSCELTKFDEVVNYKNNIIISRNEKVYNMEERLSAYQSYITFNTFLYNHFEDNKFNLNFNDEILKESLIMNQGRILPRYQDIGKYEYDIDLSGFTYLSFYKILHQIKGKLDLLRYTSMKYVRYTMLFLIIWYIEIYSVKYKSNKK